MGSHLAWHATTVGQAEPSRAYPAQCPLVTAFSIAVDGAWSGTLVCTLRSTEANGSQCSSLCQDMFLPPATDPSAAPLRWLWHTVYADTCTDTVTFGLLQQFVCLQLTDYTPPSALCSVCKTLQLDFSVVLLPGRMHHLSWIRSTGCQCRAEFSLYCVYFDVWHQSWYCSTILVRTRPALWRHPASLQCARQLRRFAYLASCNWQSFFPSPGHVPGMHCRLTWNWFHLAPVSASSRHFLDSPCLNV